MFEKRLIDGEAAAGLSAQGPCCDLMILGKGGMDDSRPAVTADVLQYVVMNGGCPVLIVPSPGSFRIPGRRALVAWNGSTHAARAVRQRTPLAQAGRSRDIAVAIPVSRQRADGEEIGADIALYLARHGINVEIIQEAIWGRCRPCLAGAGCRACFGLDGDGLRGASALPGSIVGRRDMCRTERGSDSGSNVSLASARFHRLPLGIHARRNACPRCRSGWAITATVPRRRRSGLPAGISMPGSRRVARTLPAPF